MRPLGVVTLIRDRRLLPFIWRISFLERNDTRPREATSLDIVQVELDIGFVPKLGDEILQ